MRNVINYVAYPILDLQTKKVKEVLYFVDTQLQKRKKELLALDRESYLTLLEHDYAKRSIEDWFLRREKSFRYWLLACSYGQPGRCGSDP